MVKTKIEIAVGVKVGLLNGKTGRYMYCVIEKIEGEDVFLVGKIIESKYHIWFNHWKTTMSDFEMFLKQDNVDVQNRKSWVLKARNKGELALYDTNEYLRNNRHYFSYGEKKEVANG